MRTLTKIISTIVAVTALLFSFGIFGDVLFGYTGFYLNKETSLLILWLLVSIILAVISFKKPSFIKFVVVLLLLISQLYFLWWSASHAIT